MSFAAVTTDPTTLFAPAAAQRALLALLLLALLAALLGWAIVLRDLPFFTHAVGAGSYPALVLGAAAGVSLAVSALAGALVFALVLAAVAGGVGLRAAETERRETLTGLAVAGALALGTVLATQITTAGEVSPEGLLFGSLLAVDPPELIVLSLLVVATAAVTTIGAARWLAGGFDPGTTARTGMTGWDLLLYVVVAAAAGAALPVTGALLVGALLVVPAATARMLTERVRLIPPLTLALVTVEGVGGLWIALATELPPGPTIAVLAGVGFFAAAGVVRLRERRLPRAVLPLTLLASAALLVGGCGSQTVERPGSTPERPLAVVATTADVAEIVENVGGHAVDVTTLVPRGQDAAELRPDATTVEAIRGAGAIFREGGSVDDWLPATARRAGIGFAPVDLSRSVLLDERSGGPDTHWFNDRFNRVRAAQRVRDELIKAAPPARETFRANATHYINQLETDERR